VKETCIEEGRLKHDDLAQIWSAYDESIHEWMLKLTEEFDLTFAVSEKRMSIVPCLLPDQQPEFDWPSIDDTSGGDNTARVKEYQVIYDFDYLPAGLFNRIQVRLYNYADSSHMWSCGSILRKNNQLALMTQKKKSSEILVKVQGVKPENIVFVIHEVYKNYLIFIKFFANKLYMILCMEISKS
jgi:leucine-rich repeat kinase 2